jgi:hypothetical protein
MMFWVTFTNKVSSGDLTYAQNLCCGAVSPCLETALFFAP